MDRDKLIMFELVEFGCGYDGSLLAKGLSTMHDKLLRWFWSWIPGLKTIDDHHAHALFEIDTIVFHHFFFYIIICGACV